MKRLLILLPLLLCLTTRAQTNTPPTSLLPGGLGQLVNDVGAFLTDAQPYFGTNGSLMAGGGALINNKKVGAFADVTLWSLTTNNQVAIGFAAAYLNGNFYDASLNLKAGTTWTVPVLGSFYTQILSGPGYNFKQHHAMAENFVIVHRKFTIGTWLLDPFAGVGNLSDQPGAAYIAGINVKPPGW